MSTRRRTGGREEDAPTDSQTGHTASCSAAAGQRACKAKVLRVHSRVACALARALLREAPSPRPRQLARHDRGPITLTPS